MMRRLPSVKTLESAFPGKGKQLRKVLEMTKAQLIEHPAGAKRWAECYHPPSCYDLRLHVLDAIAETYGVEYIASVKDTFTQPRGFDYLNTGHTYALTIIRMAESGNYRVSSWGDIVERGGYQ
jgi:hypothetical protein